MKPGKLHLVTYETGDGLVSEWLKFVNSEGSFAILENTKGDQIRIRSSTVLRVTAGRRDDGSL